MNQRRILRVEDLLELIPVSRATLDRWVKESREGRGDFIIPFSKPGRRMLWDKDVIEQWITNRHKATSPNPPPVKNEKQKVKAFGERQKQAAKALARHASKTKAGQNNSRGESQ